MTTTADGGASSPEKSNSAPPQGIVPAFNDDIVEKLKTLEETASPWIDYALKQAQAAQKTIGHHLQDAIEVTKSRLDRIRTTSSAHFNQTLDSLQDAKSDFNAYEDLAIGKIREGFNLAAANPFVAAGSIFAVGLLGLKRPRRILYYKLRRLFASEQVLLSKADAKVKELRQSFEVLKAEAEKLEKAALQAEEEMTRGRTKLRQAGKQIQSVVRSAYKIERQAVGLKDVLRDLPSIEASRFRSQVSNLAKEAKKERRVLNKEVTRISNYGISV
ncbi:RGS1-HXK1-interacting protein 1-like isoform X2 [Coffea arabica]|uniref:RGS1-HXK1-interacting protein 1-like isoform X2 n=1 Tax=Coffea arabica TaxID=13443 RepID=A0ABM4WI25_COFAR